ncbi:MAG: NAD(P)/FAD-dependent oxidoreductase [Alphaproteobacteria bacterium]
MTAPLAAAALKDRYQLAIVGAGPAGLAAATLAAEKGIDTVLFDEQPMPGGQIYRSVGKSPVRDRAILGEDYWKGGALVDAFQASRAAYVPNATVWQLAPDREIGVSVGGAARLVRADRVILATGAMERPMPIPGWTLPGVMTAGAGQILLKSMAMVPSGRIVIAGLGPLLYLIAWQYLRAGVKIDAILETTPRGNRWGAAAHLPAFLLSPYFAKGRKLLSEVRRRVRVVGMVEDIRADGGDKLQSVTWARGAERETIPADLLLLHQGVVPNVNLAMAAGCAHEWDAVQLCFNPVLDAFGESSIPGIAIAGDGAGIGGAESAAHRGRLAAIAAARALGAVDATTFGWEAPRHQGQLARTMRGRAFLDALFRPPHSFRVPTGDTVVCRCEEVTAADVVDAVAKGCPGPNQMKALLRSGMGPCQGRMCGLTVTETIAAARNRTPAEIGYYRLRAPVKPITLAELANLPASPEAVAAVVR